MCSQFTRHDTQLQQGIANMYHSLSGWQVGKVQRGTKRLTAVTKRQTSANLESAVPDFPMMQYVVATEYNHHDGMVAEMRTWLSTHMSMYHRTGPDLTSNLEPSTAKDMQPACSDLMRYSTQMPIVGALAYTAFWPSAASCLSSPTLLMADVSCRWVKVQVQAQAQKRHEHMSPHHWTFDASCRGIDAVCGV